MLTSIDRNFENECYVKLDQELEIPSACYQSTAGRIQESFSPSDQEIDACGSDTRNLEGTKLSTQQGMSLPQTGFDLEIDCSSIKWEENKLSTQQSVSVPLEGFDLKSVILDKWKSVISFRDVAEFDHQKNDNNSLASSSTSRQKTRKKSKKILPNRASNEQENTTEESKSEPIFFCSVCNLDCGSIELFDEHRGKSSYICRVCTSQFNNHQELETHFFSHEKHTCEVCKMVFHCESDLSNHKKTVKTCKLPHKNKCGLCYETFASKSRLSIHIKNIHGNAESKEYICVICTKLTSFKCKHQFYKHMRTKHSAFENIECDICGKLFLGPQKLKSHIKEYHIQTEIPYPCPICKKIYTTKKSLDAHMGIHSGEEIVCEICGTLVKGKRMLYNHMRNHRESKSCDICNVSFKSRYEKDFHNMKVHKKGLPTPVICEVCGKEFKGRANLKQHKRSVHSDEKPYVCETCGAAFKMKNGLSIHSRIHSNEQQYACTHCGKGFRWKQTYDKHVLKCESLDKNNSSDDESE